MYTVTSVQTWCWMYLGMAIVYNVHNDLCADLVLGLSWRGNPRPGGVGGTCQQRARYECLWILFLCHCFFFTSFWVLGLRSIKCISGGKCPFSHNWIVKSYFSKKQKMSSIIELFKTHGVMVLFTSLLNFRGILKYKHARATGVPQLLCWNG